MEYSKNILLLFHLHLHLPSFFPTTHLFSFIRKVPFPPWNPILLKPTNKQLAPHKHRTIATTNQLKPLRTHNPLPKYTNRTMATPEPNPKNIICDATIISSPALRCLIFTLHLHLFVLCTKPAEPPPSNHTTIVLWSRNHHASHLSSERDVVWFGCCLGLWVC